VAERRRRGSSTFTLRRSTLSRRQNPKIIPIVIRRGAPDVVALTKTGEVSTPL
jgi:hypothetical protein